MLLDAETTELRGSNISASHGDPVEDMDCLRHDDDVTHFDAMGNLPGEILVHILNFCHIKQVCVCMSVCKKWQSASRYAIRTKKSLIMCEDRYDAYEKTRKCLSYSVLDDLTYVTGRSKKRHPSVINLLDQMRNLRCLILTAGAFTNEAVSHLITRNASSLRTIITSYELPADPNQCYPMLRHVDCMSLNDIAAKSSLSLQKLNIGNQKSNQMCSFLPIHSMRELRGVIHSWPGLMTVNEFVSGACRLTLLNKISIQCQYLECKSLERMFECLQRLTHVRVAVTNPVNMDHAIASLVQHNQVISCLKLWKVMLRDPALTSLSHLTNLKTLKLVTIDSRLSLDAVLTLLRGRSRRSLDQLMICHDGGTDWSAAESEINCIARERGCSFRVEHKWDCIHFQLQ